MKLHLEHPKLPPTRPPQRRGHHLCDFVKVENVAEIFNAFFMAGRFPVTAFPPWVRFLLTFVVPIAFITTVPASAAIGRLSWSMALASFVVAGLLLGLSHLFWRVALANYTSASS